MWAFSVVLIVLAGGSAALEPGVLTVEHRRGGLSLAGEDHGRLAARARARLEAPEAPEAPKAPEGLEPKAPDKPPDSDEVIDDIQHIVEEEVGSAKPMSEEEAKEHLARQLEKFLDSMGLKANDGQGFKRVLETLRASGILIAVCFLAFSTLRRWFPQVYSNNCRDPSEGGYGSAPYTPRDTFTGWIPAAMVTTYEECEMTSGTDAALCLVFLEFVIQVVATVGIGLVCVLCPLHYYYGDVLKAYHDGTAAERLGWLSSLSLNNVPHGSWLVWVHAAAVWYVVLVVELLVFRAMRVFMPIRFKWLQDLTPPRSTTLLVENIPEEYCSDEAIKEFFTNLFPDAPHTVVESAFIVKKIGKLEKMVEQYCADEVELQGLRHDLALYKEGEDITTLKEDEKKRLAKMDLLAAEAEAEQQRVLRDAQTPMIETTDMFHGHPVMKMAPEAKAVNSQAGFVAFTSERLALMVLNMRCYSDAEHFIMSIPPCAADIIYEDLQLDMQHQSVMDAVGYFVVSLVFYAFIPTIILFARIIRAGVQAFPVVEELGLDGVLATLPLQVYLAMLPTVLFLIFHSFFSLKAAVWGQKFLQSVFFTFNVMFTLLVTAIVGALSNYPGGQRECIMAIVRDPWTIPGIFAASLPAFSQYYICFMMVRWTQHCLELTRYVTLAKFLLFRYLYGEELAMDLCEPEDQDFYGIGARSVRFVLDFIVGLIFCSMSPVIMIVTLVNAIISRACFGYLLIFAETRKHDIGGVFFVTMLKQVQLGLCLYVVFMIGAIALWSGKEQGAAPATITTASLVYAVAAYHRFSTKFVWDTLPFMEVTSKEAVQQSAREWKSYKGSSQHDNMLYRQWQLYQKFAGRHHERHHHTLARLHSHAIEGVGQESPRHPSSTPQGKALAGIPEVRAGQP